MFLPSAFLFYASKFLKNGIKRDLLYAIHTIELLWNISSKPIVLQIPTYHKQRKRLGIAY